MKMRKKTMIGITAYFIGENFPLFGQRHVNHNPAKQITLLIAHFV